MEWSGLFHLIQSWGPSAISSVLVFIVLYLLKQVNKNSEDDAIRAKKFQDSLDEKTKELRSDVNKTIEDHGKRLSYIELEYVRRDTFYRELGGWKDDINRLSSQISTQFMEFTKGTIELWKEKLNK
jgi:hypothetical protein